MTGGFIVEKKKKQTNVLHASMMGDVELQEVLQDIWTIVLH